MSIEKQLLGPHSTNRFTLVNLVYIPGYEAVDKLETVVSEVLPGAGQEVPYHGDCGGEVGGYGGGVGTLVTHRVQRGPVNFEHGAQGRFAEVVKLGDKLVQAERDCVGELLRFAGKRYFLFVWFLGLFLYLSLQLLGCL